MSPTAFLNYKEKDNTLQRRNPVNKVKSARNRTW